MPRSSRCAPWRLSLARFRSYGCREPSEAGAEGAAGGAAGDAGASGGGGAAEGAAACSGWMELASEGSVGSVGWSPGCSVMGVLVVDAMVANRLHQTTV